MVSEAGGERLRRAHFKALKERKIMTSRRDFDLGSTESLPTGLTLPAAFSVTDKRMDDNTRKLLVSFTTTRQASPRLLRIDRVFTQSRQSVDVARDRMAVHLLAKVATSSSIAHRVGVCEQERGVRILRHFS